ncbi:fatty acid desaturase family protein [Fulvivirga sediminis]|uniref:Fatty acid desaturase n=1 Tax=Fulvivirga sediminis TaxID=2803949 RepID=A0A937FCE5_9BACT|nr:acyl-CoA desaturase [Fulvivirga sediminis]MBL3658619.1 fatty acid desaturase [Fulvivirga sediminis]
MLTLFFVPLIIVNTGIVTSPFMLFAMYILAAFGMSGIGMGVMHDAIHGAYSKNRKINKYMGYTMNLIGANASIWKIQHNVLHHTYTNIEDSDDDINAPFFLRFSPHAKRYKVHRFQHLYIWFFYGLSTLSWITVKDFVRMYRYRKMGFFGSKTEYRKEIAKVIAWKLLYYSYVLVLPMIMVPLAPWMILLAFVVMHFITGLAITTVFQTAHVMPSTAFPLPDENGIIASDWFIHQLATTSNFSPKSRFFSWLIGGLNFQIEHHLLPNICHVHYKKLSKIVAETAKEYGIPYHTKRTFVEAIWDHVKMLRQLGRMEMVPVPQSKSQMPVK